MSKPIRKLKTSALQSGTITVSQLSQSLNDSITTNLTNNANDVPKILSISYPNGANANTQGGETITLRGTNFLANINVFVNGVSTTVTRTNTSHMTFVTVASSAGFLPIYVRNPDGGASEFLPGLNIADIVLNFQGSVSGYIAANFVAPKNTAIDKFPFATNQGETNVGTLTTGTGLASGHKSDSSGYVVGGVNPPSTNLTAIQKYPFSTNQNSTSGGTLSVARGYSTGHSSATHGYTAGNFPADANIYKFPYATSGTSTLVGTLSTTLYSAISITSNTSGYSAGGYVNPVTKYRSSIDKFSFATDQNATNIGTLVTAKGYSSGQSSTTHGYATGGLKSPPTPIFVATIERFPFATNQNAATIGQITLAKYGVTGVSSTTNGYSLGGVKQTPAAVVTDIDRFPFATNQNGTNVAQLVQGRYYATGSQF